MPRDNLAMRWRALAWDCGPIWAAVLIGIMVAPSMLVIEGSRGPTAPERVSRSADDSGPADPRCRADNPFTICRLRRFAPAWTSRHAQRENEVRKHLVSPARFASLAPSPAQGESTSTGASPPPEHVPMGSNQLEPQARCAPSPRLRGEGWGEGDSPSTQAVESPPHPLASLATSQPKSDLSDFGHSTKPNSGKPEFGRKRGEVESAARSQCINPAHGFDVGVDHPSPERALGAMREVDPFNAYAHADAAPALAVEPDSVDDYLFEAYRRLPEKRDASGDFTWKDPAAAERFGLPLDRYVIGGMDPDFKELVYAAGKRMDAAGVKWSILAAFRDDWRQRIASGFKASAENSCHGGSRAVGGYGNGRCVDVWTTEGPVDALFAWIDGVGRTFGLLRPMPSADPAHVGTVGDWRAIAQRLRIERLTGPILATARALAGSDVVAGLTELVMSPAPEMPITTGSNLPANTTLAARVTVRRNAERKAGRHARLSCARHACAEPAS